MTTVRLHRERDVVEGGEGRERRGDLERAAQADRGAPINGQRRDVAAREPDATLVGRDFAGELADQRGLTRPVRADDSVQLARGNRKRDLVRGDNAAEALGQALDCEQRISHGALLPGAHSCHRAQTAPPGETAGRARSANIPRSSPRSAGPRTETPTGE